MMFKRAFHAGIVAGTTTVSYRSWKRAQVRTGGIYYLHPLGEIEVVSVEEAAGIDADDLQHTGFTSREDLLKALGDSAGRRLFRVGFRFLGPRRKPVAPLDEQPVDDAAFERLERDLDRKDQRAGRDWTRPLLTLIGDQPGASSAVLAEAMAMERMKLKQEVRKLKKLGLTISLETGYRVSKWGWSYLDRRGGV